MLLVIFVWFVIEVVRLNDVYNIIFNVLVMFIIAARGRGTYTQDPVTSLYIFMMWYVVQLHQHCVNCRVSNANSKSMT